MSSPVHHVAVLALDGVYPFELGIPSRVFGAADGRYEVRTCALDGPSVRTNADFSVTVDHGPELLTDADTVVIPPFDTARITRHPSPTLRAALDSLRPDTRLVSICTGAFVLASTGLLNDRPATTHWALTDTFRTWFPRVRLDPDVLFVDDGDVLTSAGAASGVDVCLHLVRRDHGTRVANHVARVCVVPPWRDGGQAQYIEHPVPDPDRTGTAPTRQWALEHLAEPLSLADLAAHARMSRRTFVRRFNEEVGLSPGRWLTAQRVERARHLLESTDLTVDEIAGRIGFATGTSLRQHLRTALGVSPITYRRTFRGAPDPVPSGEPPIPTRAIGFPIPTSRTSLDIRRTPS
ncbi:helix-turn-helix domain-containing protein [Nocardiopsis sp. N85]|uniref:GlxA family transcriptional regulator n=1 Tax=Nocardiopsis sp. N85 TaxID=3029400 RepID=UPI00237F8108|nr:helix-turn-helix domain-containing protein [Nocardiopsis sp. N85]MDE3722039.1 helix-turn-helix domain-containing protein [Nocardiopsis sp. N85]